MGWTIEAVKWADGCWDDSSLPTGMEFGERKFAGDSNKSTDSPFEIDVEGNGKSHACQLIPSASISASPSGE